MSVINKSNKEINNLVNHLFLYPEMVENTTKMDAFDSAMYAYQKTEQARKEFIEIYIITLFDRLSLANQMAFAYGYNEPLDLERLDFELDGGYLAWDHITPERKRDFHNDLKSLDYNLYTNNGRSFVSQQDLEVLKMLIEETEEWGKWMSVMEKKQINAHYRMQD